MASDLLAKVLIIYADGQAMIRNNEDLVLSTELDSYDLRGDARVIRINFPRFELCRVRGICLMLHDDGNRRR